MAKRVLFVVYKPAWADNRLAALLGCAGVSVEVCCPRDGDRLPDRTGGYDGLVVGGGLDSVNAANDHPYMAAIRDSVRREVEAGTPYLGLCLGAQVLAHAFGARVRSDWRGAARVGYHTFASTPLGQKVFGQLDTAWFCHTETFEVPAEGELLAFDKTFTNQAFRIGRHAYALQFHPEVSAQHLPGFLDEVTPMLEAPGTHPPARQLREAAIHDGRVDAWLRGFLLHWIGVPA